MLIRKAAETDHPQIIKILKALDLYYSALVIKDFWVTEDNGKIVGTAQLEEFPSFLFLGSVGVASDRQKQGVAKTLLEAILKDHKKDVYLYTIIPEFFEKFGFEITTTLPTLPGKERYECEACHLDRCVTMVRHAS